MSHWRDGGTAHLRPVFFDVAARRAQALVVLLDHHAQATADLRGTDVTGQAALLPSRSHAA